MQVVVMGGKYREGGVRQAMQSFVSAWRAWWKW